MPHGLVRVRGIVGKCSQNDDAHYSLRALRVYNDKCD